MTIVPYLAVSGAPKFDVFVPFLTIGAVIARVVVLQLWLLFGCQAKEDGGGSEEEGDKNET